MGICKILQNWRRISLFFKSETAGIVTRNQNMRCEFKVIRVGKTVLRYTNRKNGPK